MKELIKTIIERTNWMKAIVGLTILAIFSAQSIFLLFYEIPTGNREILHLLIGETVGIVMGNLVNFYFGTSLSSEKKTALIEKLTDRQEITK
jgi:hypothetical protein